MNDINYLYETSKPDKKRTKMAQSKILLFILNYIVPPAYIFAWIVNVDNVKGTILFIFALATAMIRVYYWVIRVRQNNRMRELEIEEKEISNAEKRGLRRTKD